MHDGRRPLVVGWGNCLRRDDGIGPRVAAEVARRLGDTVELRTPIQLLPELALDIARASRVVLVDAAVDQPPGTVRCRAIAATRRFDHQLHDLRPETILAHAGTLTGCPTPTWLVTVGAADIGLGEGLSPEVEDALGSAAATVCRLLCT